MRVKIAGGSDSAIRLRSLIRRDPHLVLGDCFYDVEVTLNDARVVQPVLDGIDGPVERVMLAHIGALTPSGQVLVQYDAGHVTSDRKLEITVPAGNEGEAYAVEHGVYRGLLDLARAPRRRWWRR